MNGKLLNLLIILLIISCRKADRDLDKSIVDCQDNGIALTLITDIWRVIDEACKSTPALRASSISCAGIAYDDTQNPMLLQVDFGTSGCSSTDGRNRRGKIICTLTSNYTNPGTVINMSLQHFYIENYKVEGTITFTNLGINAQLQSEYKINTTTIKITNNDTGWSLYWGCDINLVWASGENTLNDFTDDTYVITGNTTGTNHKGNKYTAKIIQAAVLNSGCRWLQNATVEVAPQGLTKRKMTFSAACSNTVEVIVNGYDYVVQLP